MLKKTLDIAFIIIQVLLPKHLLSRLIAKLGDTEIAWLKNTLINIAIDAFKINMEEAAFHRPKDYLTFNDFFMRPLKDDARIVDKKQKNITSPCDGEVSQCGKIEQGSLIQAKGKYFDLLALLGGSSELTEKFNNGHFATIYLAPKDYHRVHMPCNGELNESIYVPGELFSVNQSTAQHIDGLFARNERLINVFTNGKKGNVASIMVGAMLVAGIETVWGGQVVPPKTAISCYQSSKQEAIKLKKGEEMGRFKFGSTVILLFPEGAMDWLEDFTPGTKVNMGQAIGKYL